jgi:3-deoxy-D-manno-octulosonic-acid transferase
MGVLSDLYAAADLAFVGGTLVDIGGHNLLEPVWSQTPVLFGPYIRNVRDAAEYIVAHDYGARVSSPEELAAVVRAVVSGRRTFRRRPVEETEPTACKRIGEYMMRRLDYA